MIRNADTPAGALGMVVRGGVTTWTIDGIQVRYPEQVRRVLVGGKSFKVLWADDPVPRHHDGAWHVTLTPMGYIEDTGMFGARISLLDVLRKRFEVRIPLAILDDIERVGRPPAAGKEVKLSMGVTQDGFSWYVNRSRVGNPQRISPVLVDGLPYDVVWREDSRMRDIRGRMTVVTSLMGFVRDRGDLGATVSLEELLQHDRHVVAIPNETLVGLKLGGGKGEDNP